MQFYEVFGVAELEPPTTKECTYLGAKEIGDVMMKTEVAGDTVI